MQGVGIFSDDLVIVDRSKTARHGNIVSAQPKTECVCKHLHNRYGQLIFMAENSNYRVIVQTNIYSKSPVCETILYGRICSVMPVVISRRLPEKNSSGVICINCAVGQEATEQCNANNARCLSYSSQHG
ncbi:hypothetical protein IFT47_26765 [Pseudomonas sp. CFBP 13711]|uniref:LexA family protein n=1 Tax=unclassified Pseudomonas TaxID=196821 RepID=UPI00177B47F9|nr:MULTISPECIES: S24 family peptidase [unclassified Pseudomonas]MBD8710235.1 hypothetical protein [Pseudomonas sp. CFBP 13711]MBD8715532.1 hypothetical protein [Pseudomonas sp. CFBP 13715]